jgi:MarR family transcriptional regulator, lower aerobic nicotinate degradation pathway regulator
MPTQPNHYDRLFSLMDHWKEYEYTTSDSDMERFSVWLNKRAREQKRGSEQIKEQEHGQAQAIFQQDTSHFTPINSASHSAPASTLPNTLAGLEELAQTDTLEYYKRIPVEGQIGALLSRMSRFLQFYMKKVFEGTAISSVVEFGILACASELGSPKKIEVINFNLIEKTTGTEIIKRLVRSGLLDEFDDTQDKRAKRVRITKTGQDLLDGLLGKLFMAGMITTGNLDHQQKLTLAAMLNELNHFHNDIYYNHSDADLQTIIEDNIIL